MKPCKKPVVLNNKNHLQNRWAKHTNNQRLTLETKQNKTISMGFSITKTKTHTTVSLPNKKGFLFCFFSLCGKLFDFFAFERIYQQIPVQIGDLR